MPHYKPIINPGFRIMIVGDAPTTEDWIMGRPFHPQKSQGKLLREWLASVGVPFDECSISTVAREAPLHGKLENLYDDKGLKKPNALARRGAEALVAEVADAKPTVILALGPLALQSLTGKIGISKWRGSSLAALPQFGGVKVIPTWNPGQIIKKWDWRPVMLRDLKRLADESNHPLVQGQDPRWNFRLRPAFSTVMEVLDMLIRNVEVEVTPLSVDIETRASRTSCVGIAWDKWNAICIPLMDVLTPDKNYWKLEEEICIMRKLEILFTHPNARIIGQNFGYDAQYFAVQAGFLPIVHYDTMLMQHVAFLGQKKSLDYISSMYCEYYAYWKDDGKHWDPKMPEEQHWQYNCEDCVRTFECAEVLDDVLVHGGQVEQYHFLRDMWPHIVRTMLRGVLIDRKEQSKVAMELMTFIGDVKAEVVKILGHDINPGSPKQMAQLFYGDLGMKVVRDKKTKQPTCNDDALQTFKKREPLLTGLIDRIAMIRSASTLLSNFGLMTLDIDKRMRCYYNVAGTETLRLNSGENAFGSGRNLQNIPKGDEDKEIVKKLERMSKGQRQLLIPNIRKMFVPDPGMTFFDVDLDRADLMVVIWEADDDGLRAAIAAGVDLHTYNASALFGVPENRVTYIQRQAAKMFAHGTNYGGSARTMAINCGLLVHESEVMQKRWFAEHPGIKEWHRRTEAQLQATRAVTNIFGFRRRYYDRIESVLPEALAWQPQSVVAIVINKGWKRLAEEMPEVQVLMQVHDSLAGQFPTARARPIMREMKRKLEIEIPYAKPLTIGVGISISNKSWGDCEGVDWPAPLQAATNTNKLIIHA